MQTCLNGNQKEPKFIQKLRNGENENKMSPEVDKIKSQRGGQNQNNENPRKVTKENLDQLDHQPQKISKRICVRVISKMVQTQILTNQNKLDHGTILTKLIPKEMAKPNKQ